MRSLFVPFIAAALLTSCASRPSFQTESITGRVTAVSENDGGPSGPKSQTVVAPVGNGVFIPLTLQSNEASSRYYIYTIQDASGRMLQTQSNNRFQVGDCIRLWHAPLGTPSEAASQYNFVAGTLEHNHGCN